MLLKASSTGGLLWTRSYQPKQEILAVGRVFELNGGDLLVTGSSVALFHLMRTNATGDADGCYSSGTPTFTESAVAVTTAEPVSDQFDLGGTGFFPETVSGFVTRDYNRSVTTELSFCSTGSSVVSSADAFASLPLAVQQLHS